ncbi:hypothetical protein NMG60_11012285 [Bertholletia excelsa]
MEGQGGIDSSAATVKEPEAPASSVAPAGSYVAPATSEATTQLNGSTAPAAPATEMKKKKKRGRPRKYGPDGSQLPLSPMPISASIPLSGDFSGWKQGRARSVDSFKKKHKLEFVCGGDRVAYSIGANFTPHVITVNPGEDVMMRLISFSQQGSRAICILSANGSISNVTLRQPNSSGGTLTYEGRFEILSLTGSFMPTDNGGTKSRSGGMSVSLAGSDGHVFGGGLAGLLIAARPVQVVVGSFLPGHQLEQKPKKQRVEHTLTFSPVPAIHTSAEGTDGAYSGPKPNFTPPSSLHGENITANSVQAPKSLATEIELSLRGAEAKDPSPRKCEVSC